MFYLNKQTLITTMTLMINSTDHLQLMANIKEAYADVNSNKIDDIEIRKLVDACKSFSHDIFEKRIKMPKQARAYFDLSDLDPYVKEVIAENNNILSDTVLNEYSNYFARIKYQDILAKTMEGLNDDWDVFSKTGISNVIPATQNMITSANNINDIITKLTKATSIKKSFVVNPDKESPVKSFGIEQVEQTLLEKENRKIRTGLFVDNLNGGGFNIGSLYIVASISGGFKSGLLQNIAESIAIEMSPDEFDVPTGTVPAILYLNLEMYDYQMVSRKVSFFGEDYDKIVFGDEDSPPTMEERIHDMLERHNSKIPVIYQHGTEGYSISALKADIQQYEREGYKIVCLLTDYVDLFKYEPSSTDEAERNEPIVIKTKQQREVAREFKIPVITAAQMNRAASVLKDQLPKAFKEDIVKSINSGMLAKGYSITNIAEQIYCVYKFTIGEETYFSLLVDKDRDGVAKYVDPVTHKVKDNKGKAGRKRGYDGRVHYVCKLNGFRITDDYTDTITNFITSDADTVSVISVDESDI